jgi:hypothetical protein
MSEWFQTIVDVQATEEEAEALGASVLAWLVDSGIVEATCQDVSAGGGHPPGARYATAVVEPDEDLHRPLNNGVHVITGRTLSSLTGLMGVSIVTCPDCQTAVTSEYLVDAAFEWYAGAAGTRACGGCGRVLGLNDWRWQPPWGFGYLGFEFWNWPPLAQEFIAEVGRRLGHRTVLAAGKL